MLKRLHVPELEDEPWFPRPLRDALTAFLRVSEERLDVYRGVAPIVRDVVADSGDNTIVDLCSGGGGPLLSILDELPGVDAVLTDLYPNMAAFDEAEARHPGRVRGYRDAVDATAVPDELAGVRTLFNAFHHFRPALAKRILADAAKKKRRLCICEVVERHPLTLATIAGVPLAVLALTPYTRPNALRLALTYALPIIPLATGWDGIASCIRAYSLDELRALADDVTREVGSDGYRFTVGQTARRVFPPMRVTWLIGAPTTP